MDNTEFMNPIDLGKLIEGIREGNENYEKFLFSEYDRLMNRIKSLELQGQQIFRVLERNQYKTTIKIK